MNTGSLWFQDIAKHLSAHRDALGPKEARKHKLGLLLRVARRIDAFSPDCSECQAFQPEVTGLSEGLKHAPLTREKRRKHVQGIQRVVSHLGKRHKLTSEGHHTGLGMVFGTAFGVAMGSAFDNVGTGIALGIAIGLALGAGLDAKASKEGTVI